MGGPQDRIRLFSGPSKGPVGKTGIHGIVNVADQGQRGHPSQKYGKRVQIMLITMDYLNALLFDPMLYSPGVE